MADEQQTAAPLAGLNAIPGLRQVVILAGIAAAVAFGVVVVLWARGPSTVAIFANSLSDSDTAQAIGILESSAIEYRLDDRTGKLLVPAEDRTRARMLLAAEDLPRNGRGMELITEQSGFSTSDFVETARHQHMLETELVRSIVSMAPVRNARVHLAIPKQSVFARDRESASASVVVHLHAGQQLQKSQVSAIVHIVASSVPDLNPDNVTLADHRGHLLNEPGGSQQSRLNDRQYEYAQRLERDLEGEIYRLLSPTIGREAIEATVTATLDFTVRETTEEILRPEGTLLYENAKRSDSNGPAGGGGIPGALTNQPPTGNDAGAGGEPPTTTMRDTTREFQPSRSVNVIRDASDRITRLAVAVVVDDLRSVDDAGEAQSTPYTDEELNQITQLAREAVGFNEARGDSITVINRAFVETEMAPMEAPPWWQQPLIQDLIKQGLAALMVLVTLIFVVRPMVTNLLKAPPSMVPALPGSGASAGALAHQPSDEENGAGQGGGGDAMPQLTHDERVAQARSIAADDPQRVVQIVRSWMSNEA